jgi:glycosyltransferase involved in cell wall biosynthesis
MKKILFLIGSLQYGGAERVVANLSSYFAESGRYHVSVRLLEDVKKYAVSDKVEMGAWHYNRNNLFDKIISVIRGAVTLKRFVISHDVDIVLSFMEWANSINMLSKALGSRHKAYINVRCRLKVHYKNELKKTSWTMLNWLWKYTDRTIVNSRDIKEDIVSLFNVNPASVEVVHNPLNLNEIAKLSQESVDEEWFLKRDIPLLINVGSLTKPKGHTYLLKAFSRLAARRPARLAIIGDGELRKSLTDEAKRLNVADKVLFLGWRDNPYKYMARSDIFAFSSIYEGFPNALLEAMACGCPVISFDCPSGPSEILSLEGEKREDISRARYGILVKGKGEAPLSKAIEDLLDDKEAMEYYSRAGIERARQFDLPIIAKEYEDLLSK